MQIIKSLEVKANLVPFGAVSNIKYKIENLYILYNWPPGFVVVYKS
jgi:hypothetical protein